MGWTFGPREPGTKALDYWRQEMGEGVLDCATINFKETYLAYRMNTGAVIALISVAVAKWREFAPSAKPNRIPSRRNGTTSSTPS